MKSTGTGLCLLGKTWGYDDTGVWVSDDCGGEFPLGPGGRSPVTPPHRRRPPRANLSRPGESSTPADGFLVGRSSAGELSISGYALVRYVNQMPGEQTFTDHLGNTRTVDGRNDI